MPTSCKTPASFSGFSCLGGDCEDTCCRDWEVKLDRQHFSLLKEMMSNQADTKNVFEQHIRLNENPVTGDHDYAFICMGDNGYCAMLDDKGLCSIHAKYGVSALGDVCTMFPRVISRCGDTLELSGALSCPEVVRNCIDENTPLKLVRFKTSDLPRTKNYPIQRELSNIEDDFYTQSFDLVRNYLMQVIANEEQDLETRLYVIANLSHKISEFYHRGCSKPADGKLESMLTMLSESEIVSRLNTFIHDCDVASPINMVVVHSILSIKLEQANDENISQLYKKIIQDYNVENENVAELLSQQIVKIKNRLSSDNQNFIDKAITRYIINCLYREWFVSMPEPFTYVQMLLVRISILRTLIYLDIGREHELNQEQLKQRMVYVMYNFARNIDQNLEFLKVVYNALSEQSMMTFDYSPAFIRIY